MRVKTVNILYLTFLGCLTLMPFLSIFWDESIFFLKVNWLPYPFFVLGIIAFVLLKNKINQQTIVFLAVTCFYMLFFLFRDGNNEDFLRIWISMIPFLFLPFFERPSHRVIKPFFFLYFLFFLPSLFLAYLQYTGQFPYYDFDYVDGQAVGRMSGGYSKPTNFIAFLSPLYLLGIYLMIVKKWRITGGILSAAIFLLTVAIGHRTTLLAFLLIGIGLFFKELTFAIIYNYYKYYINFFVGMFSFFILYLLKLKTGLIDAMRGRIPMWQAHAQEYFESGVFNVLFGKHQVKLPDDYAGNPIVVRLDEVHNNSFRTILLFGIVGFFLYCTLMRWIALSSYGKQPDKNKKFIMSASLIFFVLYSITNEPFYYASVVWPILIWIFLLRDHSKSFSA